MVEYVAGFLFDGSLNKVVLVKKRRPEWQKDCLNGVGGKIESGETPEQAMEREFREEAGIQNVPWKKFALLGGNGWAVHLFCASDEIAHVAHTRTDEEIGLYQAHELPWQKTVWNLRWLVPLAQDFLRNEAGPLFTAATYAS